MPAILPVLGLAVVLLAPINPAVEHNRLDWIFRSGAVTVDHNGESRRAYIRDWSGKGCESRVDLIGLANYGGVGDDLLLVIDWSKVEAEAVTPTESKVVRLEGPFGPGNEAIRSLTLEVGSPPVARSAADAFNRLRTACRPQA